MEEDLDPLCNEPPLIEEDDPEDDSDIDWCDFDDGSREE